MIEIPTYEELKQRIEALEREVENRRQASGDLDRGGHVLEMEEIFALNREIAHELNNLLGVIIGCTELSLLEIAESSLSHSHLTQILKAAKRARDLMRQVLTPGLGLGCHDKS